MNGRKPFLLACLASLCLGLVFQAPALARPAISLAVIGPMSGKDAASGQAMLDGVRLQVDRINRQGGIQGRRIKVKAYDNRHDAKLARQQARRLAESSRCAAVIGHYYSSLSLEGGRIYQQCGIPAVTGSATAPSVTEGNEWYFRVISDNRLQGRLAALYIAGVLEHSSVSIVYEQDAYGTTLTQAFQEAAGELGLTVPDVWGIDSLTANVPAKLEAIINRLQSGTPPEALYLALLDQEAAQLVRKLRDAGLNIPIIGGDSLGLGSFPREMAAALDGQGAVGDYTDGIYASTYFIRDVANRKAQRFSRNFLHRYGREPDALAATNFDAAGVVLQALSQANLDAELSRVRRQVRNNLARMSSPEQAHSGVTGPIYFNPEGNAVNPSPFGLYVRDVLVSAPVQLTPVLKPQRILDLQERIQSGELLAFQDALYRQTDVVYIGIDINEILHINQKDESFTADFYIWFRHSNPLDYSKIEFFNSDVRLDQLRDPITASTVGGMSYRAYRIKANFMEPFRFHSYPFDTQTLRIRLRHTEFNRERLIFVADDIGMQRHRGSSLLSRLRQHGGFQGDNKWELQDVVAYADIGVADSTLGNPRLFKAGAETGITFSRFNVVTEIERNAASYMFKNLVPLFFIFLLGYAMSFIVPEGPPFAARLNLGVILLLTTVSLSLMTANQLPNIGYLVTLDYVYFFVYFWLILGILVTIASRSAYFNCRHIIHRRLELAIRIIQPLLLLILLVIIAIIHG